MCEDKVKTEEPEAGDDEEKATPAETEADGEPEEDD
jgi:hypothetical protein